jgi:hypothetical protein
MSAQTSEAPRLSAALWYASLGWSVVPVHKVVVATDGSTVCSCPAGASCGSKGKHPAVAWARYQRVAATPDQIRVWFEGPYASYGVGIVTGAVSGFVVVDVDERPGKPGGETLNDLQFLNGDLPFTVMARTGGGGRHIFLLHPRDIWVITGRNVLGPGVDVRGDGGFIVAAPSMHESGRIYLWDETAHPRVTPIAPAPPWLLEMAEALPPETSGGGTGGRALPTGTGEIVRDAWGKVIDGRERFMVGIVCGVIASMAREAGALPAPEAVVAEAWPTYERAARPRGASLDADGRGIALLRQRVGHFLRRARDGKWNLDKSRETREAPPFDPETGEVIAGPRVLPPRAKVKEPPVILTMRQLDALPQPEWLVHGLIPEKSLIVPFGQAKSGKTFIVLSFCLHIAADREWFGYPVRGGGVVYIAGEGTGGLSLRLRAMRQTYGIDAGAPLWIIPKAVNFRLDGEVDGLIALVRRTVGETPLRIVVIDTLARAMPGADENSAQEVGLVIAGCDKVRDELGCAVIPVHHSGKDVARGARGTSALRGAWDTALEIAGSGKRVTMTVVDQKEAEAGQRLVFRMDTVAVGIGRTSLVPMLDETPNADQGEKEHRKPEPGGQAGMMLRTLRDLMTGPESAILPPFSDLPSGDIRGISVLIWRRGVYEKMPTVEADARRQAFHRGMQTLMERKLINVKDPWVWLC